MEKLNRKISIQQQEKYKCLTWTCYHCRGFFTGLEYCNGMEFTCWRVFPWSKHSGLLCYSLSLRVLTRNSQVYTNAMVVRLVVQLKSHKRSETRSKIVVSHHNPSSSWENDQSAKSASLRSFMTTAVSLMQIRTRIINGSSFIIPSLLLRLLPQQSLPRDVAQHQWTLPFVWPCVSIYCR